MAYRNSIINKYYTGRALLLPDLWTEIEAMGWTLHDNQDASSYRVYKSNGEVADQIYQYLKIYWTTVNLVNFYAYYYWNETTHVGYGTGYGGIGVVTTSEAGFNAWIYGNKSIFLVMTKVSTSYYMSGGGFPNKKVNTLVTTLTASATAGSNVTITVGSTTEFTADNYYQIVGASFEGRDRVQISSITDGTHMIIASLPRNYATGAKIGISPLIFGNWGYVLSFGSNRMYFGNTCTWDCVGLAQSSYPSFLGENSNPPAVDGAPDSRLGYYLLKPVWGEEGNYGSATSYHTFTFFNDEYFMQGSHGVVEDVYVYSKLNYGTAESGGLNTLTDNDKSWTIDQWIGKVVVITAGTGIGQVRKITANTATQLTVNTNWVTPPDSSSQYYICNEAYRCLVALGYYIYAREGV